MGDFSEYRNVAKLIIRDFFGVITDEENDKLMAWRNEHKQNNDLYKKLFGHLNYRKYSDEILRFDAGKGWEEFSAMVKSERKRVIRMNFLKYAAILIIPLMIGGIIYKEYLQFDAQPQHIVTNIEPGTQKAELILGSGERIDLENENEFALSENGMRINKKEAVLNYQAEQVQEKLQLVYNTINIPRGGEYVLILSDGSKVHLNSKSTLKYPVNFVGKTRQVELKGEAFFEVAKNAKQPFIVKTSNSNVEVIGTAFNVKAYEEENVVTTLVEGKVKFNAQNKEGITLEPGQQTVFNAETNELVKNNVNVFPYVAWKEGMFVFEGQRLEDIMETLTRWYDAKVFYMNPEVKDIRFGGSVNKYEKIDPILDIIAFTEKVNVKVNDNTIVFYAIN